MELVRNIADAFSDSENLIFHEEECETLAVNVVRLQKGEQSGLACHPDEEEIYLVTQGKGAVELNGTAYPVRPGQVIYVPRNYTHRARNMADELFEYVCVANWPDRPGKACAE